MNVHEGSICNRTQRRYVYMGIITIRVSCTQTQTLIRSRPSTTQEPKNPPLNPQEQSRVPAKSHSKIQKPYHSATMQFTLSTTFALLLTLTSAFTIPVLEQRQCLPVGGKLIPCLIPSVNTWLTETPATCLPLVGQTQCCSKTCSLLGAPGPLQCGPAVTS